VIRSGLLNLDPTVEKEEGGLPVRLGLGLPSPARNSGEGALVLSSGDALAAPGRRQGYDEVQGFTENTTAWTACSIGSWSDGEGRLEMYGATICFRRRRGA
jgi:hypothetical protein